MDDCCLNISRPVSVNVGVGRDLKGRATMRAHQARSMGDMTGIEVLATGLLLLLLLAGLIPA